MCGNYGVCISLQANSTSKHLLVLVAGPPTAASADFLVWLGEAAVLT